MTWGEIAGLLAALAALALVAVLAVPLMKLGKVFDELSSVVRETNENSMPILVELKQTVEAANTELTKLGLVTEDVSHITNNAADITKDAARLSRLFSTVFTGALVRTAVLTHWVRRALGSSGTRKRSR